MLFEIPFLIEAHLAVVNRAHERLLVGVHAQMRVKFLK